jgi:2'-5' RNA ligase
MDQFAILYLLPEKAQAYHEQLRLDVENEFNLRGSTLFVPAHITIKYHFETDCIEAVEGILEEFSKNQVKTSWSLNGFGHFKSDDQLVIFIDVLPSQTTRAAHARLLQELKKLNWMQWGPFDHADMHYHVTLAGTSLTHNNFDAVWKYVNQRPKPQFDLSFDNLALLKIKTGLEPIHTVYKRYDFHADLTD